LPCVPCVFNSCSPVTTQSCEYLLLLIVIYM
jgi:hypothetical protein